MTKLKQLKQKLKEQASKLRELKAQRKKLPYGYVPDLYHEKWHTRHMHIAYCLLRGKTYEQIEQKCHEAANMRLVEKYMEEYREPEDVRTSEEGSIEAAADGSSEPCGSGATSILSRVTRAIGLG